MLAAESGLEHYTDDTPTSLKLTENGELVIGAPGYTLPLNAQGYAHAVYRGQYTLQEAATASELDPTAIAVEQQLASLPGVKDARLFLHGVFIGGVAEVAQAAVVRATAEELCMPLHPDVDFKWRVNFLRQLVTQATIILEERVSCLQTASQGITPENAAVLDVKTQQVAR